MIHQPWRDLLQEPMTRDHVVQVYRDDRVLVEAVSLFAGAALGRNEAVILVVTAEHGQALAYNLAKDGFDVPRLQSLGQLHLLEAREQLLRFMAHGLPDAERFRALVGELVAGVRASRRFRELRVYGEMVNLLWADNLPAATRLEELWNDAVAEHSLSLFCGYRLDAAGPGEPMFPPSLRAQHTHFIPLAGGA